MKTLSIWLLLCVAVCAQSEPPTENIQVKRYTRFGGLNTADVYPAEGEAVTAHNVDLSRGKVGTVSKRYGFDKVDSLTAVSRIVYLKALQFDDGTKYMMVIGRDPDTGLGLVYVSNEGSVNFEQDSLTEIYSRFPVTGEVSVSKLRNQFYVTNGVGRGVVIAFVQSAFVVRPYPMVAPGEPLIVPIDTGSAGTHSATLYAMKGTVRYVFKLSRGLAATPYADISYISAPIKLDNDRVYMTGFQWMPLDTGNVDDSTVLWGYRTKTDVGNLDAGDYAYYTGKTLAAADENTLGGLIWIDSLPDAQLSSTDSVLLIEENYTGFDENTPAGFNRRYGAPGYVGRVNWEEGDSSATQPGQNYGPYFGWLNTSGGTGAKSDSVSDETRVAQGVVYACGFMDTLTWVPSDTGRSFVIERDQDTLVLSYTMSLPQPPTMFGDIAINLYRAPLHTVTHETAENCGTGYWGAFPGDVIVRFSRLFCSEAELLTLIDTLGSPIEVRYNDGSWRAKTVIDSIYVGEFKLVAQISDGSDTYTDSLRYDSIYTHPPYRETTVPPFMTSTFAYNSRLYGAYGSDLFRSDEQNVAQWELFEFVQVDPGFDEITAAWPGQFALQVKKALSSYGVDEVSFVDAEIVGRWGCLSPRSVALTPAGPIYLSERGVVLERDGQYLERTIVPGDISKKLLNFKDKATLDLKNSSGLWLREEKQYWLCVGDTTLVWDWEATRGLGKDIWTTSSLIFEGGTFYDAEDEYAIVPGRTLYFWRDNDANIYEYGDGITYPEYDYDTTTGGSGYKPILIEYETGPLLWGVEAGQVKGVAGLFSFDGAEADSLETFWFNMYDENGTLTLASGFTKLYRRYIRSEYTADPALYYQIKFYSVSNAFAALASATTLEAFELYYIPKAERIQFD